MVAQATLAVIFCRPGGTAKMLAEDSFLSRLAGDDRDALLAPARRLRYGPGAIIVAEGGPADAAFVLLSGQATAMRISADGRVISYRDICPGDLFGEIAVLDAGRRSADVVARTEAEVLRLSREAFEASLTARPLLALALLRQLAGQLRDLSERVFEKTALGVRERLIHELLRRAREQSDGTTALRPAPTHADIAARIGGHREGVTKELSALAAQGLIRRAGRAVVIPSIERLAGALPSAPLR